MSEAHRLRLEIGAWFPETAPVSQAVGVQIRAECPSGCDLSGAEVAILGPNGRVAAAKLDSGPGPIFETEELVVHAPSEVGAHQWSVSVRTPAEQGQAHAGTLELPQFRTEAHKTSVAVWDIQSPAVVGEPLSIKVGAKCAEGCDLHRALVEVCDESGERVASTHLGGEIWEGSDGLAWAQVELIAPNGERQVSWEARLSTPGHELPHHASTSSFGFITARPPNHRLTVEVVEESSTVPVPEAAVRLGVYRASTDQAGRATLSVADGTYELIVWKTGYDAPPRTLVVSEDLTVRVEAEVLPDNSDWEDD